MTIHKIPSFNNYREELMKEASYDDAVSIGRFLDVNKNSVWEIIKGREYSTHAELAMVVFRAFSATGR